MRKRFPNGFTSWHETHYQMVEFIVLQMHGEPTGKVNEVHERVGSGGLWELAEEWTDEFEKKYKGAEWGMGDLPEWFDAIEEFCRVKNEE